MSAPSASAPEIQITRARLFRGRALLGVMAYGVLLALPALLFALVAVCTPRYGLVSYVLPLLALGAATLFLPFGFGNPYVSRLVHRLPRSAGVAGREFIVQLTLEPRLRTGVRGWIEDADDIGWLEVTEAGLVFRGDSVSLSVPFGNMRQVRSRSSGWRGLFVCGQRTIVAVTGLQNVEQLEFAERSSWWVPGSREVSRRLYRDVAERVGKRT